MRERHLTSVIFMAEETGFDIESGQRCPTKTQAGYEPHYSAMFNALKSIFGKISRPSLLLLDLSYQRQPE